jgi:2-polyprenyl-3-methyl-5-hydroxy-6-metoxy-1,4-benzoquinol methylase
MIDNTKVIAAYQRSWVTHGDSALGFHWGRESDTGNRYHQLLKIVHRPQASILDFGCGSGDLLEEVFHCGLSVGRYVGVDLNEQALAAGRIKYPEAQFQTALPQEVVDYTFVSGTFNLCLDFDVVEWEAWVRSKTLELWGMTRLGMAMNFITYRPDWRRKYLWYPTGPRQIIDWVPGLRASTVLEDYGIRGEWTLLLEKA